MNSTDRKANADRILYEFGLLKKIEEIGKAHIVGSYRMDMMAWNDLDIILAIKSELISRDLYSFEKFKSMDVYKAVLESNVKNIDEFLMLFGKGKKK